MSIKTAILSVLSNNIYTIERNHDLYKNSKKLFSKLISSKVSTNEKIINNNIYNKSNKLHE